MICLRMTYYSEMYFKFYFKPEIAILLYSQKLTCIPFCINRQCYKYFIFFTISAPCVTKLKYKNITLSTLTIAFESII